MRPRGAVVQGFTTLGGLTYLTMAVVDDRADTLTMRITVDSTFAMYDGKERHMVGGTPLVGHTVTSDDRRERIQADSDVSEHLFGLFPLPEEPVPPGAVRSRRVDFLEPQGNGEQGRMYGTVKMKLRQILASAGDTRAVLELSLTASGTQTDDVIAMGLRLPQRWHVRLNRRLLTAQ